MKSLWRHLEIFECYHDSQCKHDMLLSKGVRMSQSFPHLVEKKVCFAFQLVFVVFHCNSEFLEIYILNILKLYHWLLWPLDEAHIHFGFFPSLWLDLPWKQKKWPPESVKCLMRISLCKTEEGFWATALVHLNLPM